MRIINKILEAQSGSNDATLQLVHKFNPLLKKYARKLGYEDAYSDLLVDFLSLIKKMNVRKMRNRSNGGIVLYISKSVLMNYLKKLREINKYKQKIRLLSALNKEEQYYVESLLSSFDNYERLQIVSMKQILNQHELYIIDHLFYEGFSSSDIAQQLGISRQAVNQSKLRALKKIERKLYHNI